MKKFCVLLLCLVLVFSLVACGGDKDEDEYQLPSNEELRDMGAAAASEALLGAFKLSPNSLVIHLEAVGYSTEDATAAANAIDWREQSPGYAIYYLKNITPRSKSSLIDSMVREGYSKEDATYGVDNCGADWNEQAVKHAKWWIEEHDHHISYMGTIHDLAQIADFTLEEATYGADNCGIDWKKQAAELAMECKASGDTYNEAVSYLEYVGFTPEEVEYGVFIAFGH